MAWPGNADWTSNSTIKLTAPLEGIEPVINAINERCAAVGISLLAEIVRLDKISYLTGIQNKVSQLISRFVNHLDSAGVWTGQSDIPNWTEADILAVIGDSSRLDAPKKLDKLSSEWLYQQYEILNLLLWTQTNTQSNTTLRRSHGSGGTSYIYPSVQIGVDTEIGLTLAEPVSVSNGIHNNTIAGTGNQVPVALYSASVSAAVGSFIFSSLEKDSFNSAADVYFFARPPIVGEVRDFDGAGIAIEGLNLLSSLPAQSFSSYTTIVFGDNTIFPVYPNPPPVARQAGSIGWRTDLAYFISKFNVAGGFQYV